MGRQPKYPPDQPIVNLYELLKQIEFNYIREALTKYPITKRAAEALVMNRTTLVEKMRRFGIPSPHSNKEEFQRWTAQLLP